MRKPDVVYFEELQMSMMILGFELSAAEKELIFLAEGHTAPQKRARPHRVAAPNPHTPTTADVQILVEALKSLDDEHTSKKRVVDGGIAVEVLEEKEVIRETDSNTEDCSSHGGSPRAAHGNLDLF